MLTWTILFDETDMIYYCDQKSMRAVSKINKALFQIVRVYKNLLLSTQIKLPASMCCECSYCSKFSNQNIYTNKQYICAKCISGLGLDKKTSICSNCISDLLKT